MSPADPVTGCWLWTGAPTNSGYGSLWIKSEHGRKKVGAHRAAYAGMVGPIPPKMTVDHRCRVKLCVNPEHLRLLSHRDNLLVAPNTIIAGNMAKLHATCGHLYDMRWGGTPRCRTCQAQKLREFRRRHRQ